jgi:hypothetical protein
MLDKMSIRPLIIIVSREEVESSDIASVFGSLSNCLSSKKYARYFKENIDIAFHGYDDDNRELFEIDAVRDYVRRLDEVFPYWLYFMSKAHLGLQCVLLCLLPPFLTDEGKLKHFPIYINNVLQRRWFPAMNQMVQFAGYPESEIDILTEKSMMYIFKGRFPFMSKI